jgi:hypothetical protein
MQVLTALLFSVLTYWLIDLRSGALPFVHYLTILYLDLIAAESLVVLISSIFPIFVVALALTAFANGLWMTVGGFLVTPTTLNVFWRYTFYQIDYQRYVFSALVRNQMVKSVYTCGDSCECMFVTSLAKQCMIDGTEAAQALGYTTDNSRAYVLYLFSVLMLDASNCNCSWITISFMDCLVSAKKVISTLGTRAIVRNISCSVPKLFPIDPTKQFRFHRTRYSNISHVVSLRCQS